MLIIDFTIGIGLVYQFEKGNISYVDPNICEEGRAYSHLGGKWVDFPIRYNLDSSIPDEFNDILVESFEIWDKITNIKLFKEVALFEQPTLFVSFSETSDPFALGETGLSDYSATGIITASILNLSPSKDWKILDFSCKLLPINHPGPYDIQSVMVHEIGHVLGLDHTNDEFTTMHVYYIGTFQRTLSQGEIEGFQALYGF